MRGLGDIVTMPLPTDYGPEIYANAAAVGINVQGIPGSGSGAVPGSTATPATSAPSGPGQTSNGIQFGPPLTPDAGLPQWSRWSNHSGHGSYYPAGFPPGLPAWAIARAKAAGVPNASAYTRGGQPQANPGAVDAAASWPGRQIGPGGLMIPPTAVGSGPGNNPNAWMRPPVLPDWMLPPALQRSNPLLRQTQYRRNQWDNRLIRQAAVWDWIAKHGGIKTCCAIPELGAPIYNTDPRQVMPSQGQLFQNMYSQPISAFQSGGSFTGLDVVLGSFRVPEGFDGCLNRVVFTFTGAGFVNFTGSIFWRVKIGVRYARNLGNVQNTYGTLDTAFLVPGSRIDLLSGQTVQIIANVPVLSGITGGSVVGGAFGWFYPRR